MNPKTCLSQIQSLLEVAAKAGTDDTLDEFRQMLFTMNDLMHNYIKDIATVENNQIVRFNMKMVIVSLRFRSSFIADSAVGQHDCSSYSIGESIGHAEPNH